MIAPDRTPEIADLIVGLTLLRCGRQSEINVVRMLELMSIFEDRHDSFHAGVAEQLAEEGLKS